jgi:hypothetical protein
MNNKIESASHTTARRFFRVAGPLVALGGLGFIAVALIDFFKAFGSFGQSPRLFWCFFVGMPFLFVGIIMCKLGYIGAVVRYLAGETAPVAKDTFNYMAEGTQDGVRTIARSAAEGMKEGLQQKQGSEEQARKS